LDYELEAGMPPDAPRLAPAIARVITATGTVPTAVTADRGYGQASVDTELTDLGVDLVAILRKGQPGAARRQVEAGPEFVEMVKWRTGAEGRIAALKRQHGWGRARLRGL
jgi:IS5 family transposase